MCVRERFRGGSVGGLIVCFVKSEHFRGSACQSVSAYRCAKRVIIEIGSTFDPLYYHFTIYMDKQKCSHRKLDDSPCILVYQKVM